MVLPTTGFNYIAILVSAIASFVFGWLWYSPFVFGNVWQRLSKSKMGSGKNMAFTMIANFVGVLITAYVVSYIVLGLGASSFTDAIILGFFIWLGFFASATLLGGVLWENKPFGVYLIGAGYWLVNIEIMSIILTFWK